MSLHNSTFDYLQPSNDQIGKMNNLRGDFAELGRKIESYVPDGPDRTYLLRKLRECGMWANVAITRNPDGSPR